MFCLGVLSVLLLGQLRWMLWYMGIWIILYSTNCQAIIVYKATYTAVTTCYSFVKGLGTNSTPTVKQVNKYY